MARSPNAPTIGGFRVMSATATEYRGLPNICRGYARLVREDGKQAVIWYSERNGLVQSTGQGATSYSGMTEGGVNYVATWYSPSHARKLYNELCAEVAEIQADFNC